MAMITTDNLVVALSAGYSPAAGTQPRNCKEMVTAAPPLPHHVDDSVGPDWSLRCSRWEHGYTAIYEAKEPVTTQHSS